MAQPVIQHSLSGGELAPSLFGRTDLAKYRSGVARMRNFFVDYRGGASSCMGTKFIMPAMTDLKVRLVPFTYSTLQTYILVFGPGFIAFISNGGAVLESGFGVTDASTGPGATITAPGNDFLLGDTIYVEGIEGATGFNGQFLTVANVVPGDVITVNGPNGAAIDSTNYGVYTGAGTVSRVYKITTPYAYSDLADLKFSQSADVLNVTHPNFPPYELKRFGATNWTMTPVVFGATINAPGGLSAAASAGTGAYYSYVVTSVDADGQESPASSPLAVDNVVNLSTTAGSITLSWTAVTGAVQYNVYKAEFRVGAAVPPGSAYGFVGFCYDVAFVDSNIVPDFSVTPPLVNLPFDGGNNPSVSCYFKQRLAYAASTNFPQTFWMSRPGQFHNFSISNPTLDSDAIEGTIVSNQVNAIKSLLPMPGGLISLTGSGAWQLSGGGAGEPISPVTITADAQAYNGASDLPPIVVNYDILYVQAKGSAVRDLSYNLYVNIYTGTDISVLSNHLFFGHSLREWAYAEEPFKLIWAVRDDGIMLALTFMKEQEIYGWAWRDTLGQFQSVASVTEGLVDAVYVVVSRTIGGTPLLYIERMADRDFVNAEDAWCVDCGLQSGTTYPDANLVMSAADGDATFTIDEARFSAVDVGSVIRARGGVATITSYVSDFEVTVHYTVAANQVLPNGIPPFAPAGTWTLTAPFTTFSGLYHLEGQTVSINADGSCVTPQVVTNGSITLDAPATKVTVGLSYTPQLQTLPIDTGDPTIQSKRKKINAVSTKVGQARGLKVGPSFEELTEIKELGPSTVLGSPMPLQTTQLFTNIDPLWDVEGQICYQIDDPMPATIYAIIPQLAVGDTIK